MERKNNINLSFFLIKALEHSNKHRSQINSQIHFSSEELKITNPFKKKKKKITTITIKTKIAN